MSERGKELEEEEKNRTMKGLCFENPPAGIAEVEGEDEEDQEKDEEEVKEV